MNSLAEAVTGTEDLQVTTRSIHYAVDNFSAKITLDSFASAVNLTKWVFFRQFKQATGISPMRWLWTFRVMLAAEFIAHDPYASLSEVSSACGFASGAHFSRSFKQVFKISPSLYRKALMSSRLSSQTSSILERETDPSFSSKTLLAQRAAADALASLA